MSTEVTSGQCLCGNIQYQATGKPTTVFHCHCESCRRNAGAAVATFVIYMKDQVSYIGNRKIYESSPDVYRGFCSDCGTPMTYEAKWCEDEVHISVGTLNNPEAFEPEKHVFHEQHVSWFEANDSLPRFEATSRNVEPSSWGPKKSEKLARRRPKYS